MSSEKDIIFDQKGVHDNLGYVKVGENGKSIRSYTKCCGTQAFSTGKDMPLSVRHFNRNCIYNEDGTKWIPKDDVPNILLAYAFVDPASISADESTKYKYAPWSVWRVLIPNMMQTMLGMTDAGSMVDEPSMWVKSEDVDEIVPITWD